MCGNPGIQEKAVIQWVTGFWIPKSYIYVGGRLRRRRRLRRQGASGPRGDHDSGTRHSPRCPGFTAERKETKDFDFPKALTEGPNTHTGFSGFANENASSYNANTGSLEKR